MFLTRRLCGIGSKPTELLCTTLLGLQGFKEYKKIYGVSFSEQVMKLGISKVEELEPLIASKMEGCTRHFGESHLNKATFAGILRMIYKEIVKDRPKT